MTVTACVRAQTVCSDESALQVNLDVSDEVAELEPAGSSTIPHSVRLGLYRVAEESLGNVAKHAGASKVDVRLWIRKGSRMLYLSVEDDGQGFEPQETDGHSLGLVTMQDYMGAIGGSVNVFSVPGQGTRITAHGSLEPQEDKGIRPE